MSPVRRMRRGLRRRFDLVPMTPLGQLRAGRTAHRLIQLMLGLAVYGVSMAMLLRSTLGLDPWDVFHQGVQQHWQVSFGTVVIVTSFVVLLLWIPLRQWPGVGTLLNAVVIGLATDVTLAVLSSPAGPGGRWLLLLGGIMANGLAGALYIGSQFGPGPRDGLMTGLARRTGRSIRLVRTTLEVTVLALGWLLGGTVGVGTVLYAVLIGPIVQFFLPIVTVRVNAPDSPPGERDRAGVPAEPESVVTRGAANWVGRNPHERPDPGDR